MSKELLGPKEETVQSQSAFQEQMRLKLKRELGFYGWADDDVDLMEKEDSDDDYNVSPASQSRITSQPGATHTPPDIELGPVVSQAHQDFAFFFIMSGLFEGNRKGYQNTPWFAEGSFVCLPVCASLRREQENMGTCPLLHLARVFCHPSFHWLTIIQPTHHTTNPPAQGRCPKKTVFWDFVPNYGQVGVQSPKLFSENNHSVIFIYFQDFVLKQGWRWVGGGPGPKQIHGILSEKPLILSKK